MKTDWQAKQWMPELPLFSHAFPFSLQRRKSFRKALTLIELILVIAIMGTLFGIGIPIYTNQINRARSTKAISDIYAISQSIEELYIETGAYPGNLGMVGRAKTRDPWGNPYEYLKIEVKGQGKGASGKARKDRFLVPLNTDYDLYSKGKDGKSVPPLTAKDSRDDIVRANNGLFIGEARKY